ncbi:hypothetical protein AB3S75_011797 [Citrus x aurantiifolia]
MEGEGRLNGERQRERCETKQQLEYIVFREEVIWRQKAKVHWAKEGDCNSKFFHQIVKGRLSRNSINRLEIGDGSIVEDKAAIENQILEDKSPGSDGFSLAVYQDCWDVIKQDLLAVFREFYKSGVVNSSTNSTFICLIPKKNEPSKLSEFRLISLVTSLCKIISKVLSLRLKEVLEESISYSQGAFVRDRHILDAVLVANEAVKEYRKCKRSGLVFKIDFEKAYDHVD